MVLLRPTGDIRANAKRQKLRDNLNRKVWILLLGLGPMLLDFRDEKEQCPFRRLSADCLSVAEDLPQK